MFNWFLQLLARFWTTSESSAATITFFFPKYGPADIATYCRENGLIVKEIKCNTHKANRNIGYRRYVHYKLICEDRNGNIQHICIWMPPYSSHSPFIFRKEMKSAEEQYFNRIGLPRIEIIDPGEQGSEEVGWSPPPYDMVAARLGWKQACDNAPEIPVKLY